MKTRPLLRSGQLATAIFALFSAQLSTAADSTWTRTLSPGNWGTAGNWSAGVPLVNDTATFGTLSVPMTVNINLSPRPIKNITFDNASVNGYQLQGSLPILLTAGGVVSTALGNGAHTDAISAPIEIQGDSGSAYFTAQATNDESVLSILSVSGVSLIGNTTTLTLNGDNLGGNSVSGLISDGIGDGESLPGQLALVKSGAGTWKLGYANSYSGATTVSQGTLVLLDGAALGSGVGGTLVSSGAALILNGPFTVSGESLNLSGGGISDTGALRNVFGDNTLTGRVTLGAAARINSEVGLLSLTNVGTIEGDGFGLTVGGTSQTTIASIINTGAGTLYKDGQGTLTLTGANAYTGLTTVSAGVVNIRNATGLGTVASGTEVSASAALQIQGGITVGNEAIKISGLGILDTVSSLYTGAIRNVSGVNVWQGTVTLDGGSRINSDTGSLTFNTANPSIDTASNNLILGGASGGTVAGAVIGTGALTKDGAGTWTLGGTNTYSGGTTVSAGKLAVNGSTSTTGTVTVASGATLSGTGTVGGQTTILSGGIHSPGNSPGVETFTSGITYNTVSVFEWELSTNVAKLSGGDETTPGSDGGAVRGTDFDGVNVNGGAVTINSGAIFKILLGVDFVPTDTFWNSRQVWNVFQLDPLADPAITKTGVFNSFQVWDANGVDLDTQYLTDYSSQGYFSFAYNTDGLGANSGNLIWTPVPEPTSALAGLLIGAGLLRRRRKLA